MKKRIASLFMAIVMVMTLATGAMAANQTLVQGNTTGLSAAQFKDLADNSKPDGRHWAWDSIDQVVKAGLFNGTSATTFAPQNPMTRAQFVVVITRLENTTRSASNKLNVERVPTENRFTDVPTDMWCAGAVKWAESNGIVEGYSDNTFRPNQAISRAQIAAFVYRYVYTYKRYSLKTVTPEPTQFTDFALASTVFQTAINYCRTHDLIRGYSDHTLRPNISVTRAQVAAILSRIIIIINDSGGRSGGGGGGGLANSSFTNNIAGWGSAAYGVKFVAVDANDNAAPAGSSFGTASLSDNRQSYAVPMNSGDGAISSVNYAGFTLAILPAGNNVVIDVKVYPDNAGTITSNVSAAEEGATALNTPADYADNTTAANPMVGMTQVQFNTNRKVTVVATIGSADDAQATGVKLTVDGLANEGNSTVTLQKQNGTQWDAVGTRNVNGQLEDQGSADAAVTYRVIVKPDTATGYELERFALTEDTANEADNSASGQAYGTAKGSRVSDKTAGNTGAPNGRPYSKLAATDVAAYSLDNTSYQSGDYVGIYWFTVQPGGLANVDVVFKQYEGYLLTATSSLGNEMGTFTTSKRSYNDSLMASLLLMNNNITENGRTLDGNADALVGANANGGFAKAILDDISDGLNIEVKGSVLDKILQDSINDTLQDREATLVNQVTGMASSATPSADWVTKVEDQITKALKTEVQNAGGTWKNDWRAVVERNDVAIVTFQPTEASYEALTSTVLSDIKQKLSSGAFSIEAQTTAVAQADGSTLFYVNGAISGGPINLSPINQNIIVEMLFNGRKTGAGPRYVVKDGNGNGASIPNVVDPRTNQPVFTFSGTITMESLNDAASRNPINIQYSPDPIQSSDIPSTAVEVKNFLKLGTVNSKFNSLVNRLTSSNQTAAVTELKKIYDPANPTTGYIKVYTSAEDASIIDRITMGSDTILQVTSAPDPDHAGQTTGKKDAIRINPYLDHWNGQDQDVGTRTPNGRPNSEDLKDSGKHFDELFDMLNSVRDKFTDGFVLDSLNKHTSLFTISCATTGTSPSDAELKEAFATAMEMDDPKCADVFRALGPKADGITSITLTVNKTFSSNGQIGGAVNTAFGSSEVESTLTISRYATMDEAVHGAQNR